MTTTLTTTPRPDTADVLVVAQVTTDGAPHTLDSIGAGWVGWTATAGVTLNGDGTGTGELAPGGYLSKSLTGLTIGIEYAVQIDKWHPPKVPVWSTDPPSPWTIRIVGMDPVALSQVFNDWATTFYVFTATATTHELRITDTLGQEWPPSGLLLRDDQVAQTDPGALVSLTRSDANGTAPVRLQTGQDLATGTLIVADHEAALTGAITYTITTGDGTTTSTTSLAGLVTSPRLAVAVQGLWSMAVREVVQYAAETSNQATIHQVIGRPDPLVTLGVMGARTGTLEVWCEDYATALEVVHVHARGEVVQYRQADHPGLDMYYIPTRVQTDPYPENTPTRRWRVEVAYVEVARPTGPLLGQAGWTYDDTTALGTTYATTSAVFPTYNDRTLGLA